MYWFTVCYVGIHQPSAGLVAGLLTRPWAHEAKAEAEATESEAEAKASHHEAKAEATN